MTEKIKNLFLDAGEHSKHSAAINMKRCCISTSGIIPTKLIFTDRLA